MCAAAAPSLSTKRKGCEGDDKQAGTALPKKAKGRCPPTALPKTRPQRILLLHMACDTFDDNVGWVAKKRSTVHNADTNKLALHSVLQWHGWHRYDVAGMPDYVTKLYGNSDRAMALAFHLGKQHSCADDCFCLTSADSEFRVQFPSLAAGIAARQAAVQASRAQEKEVGDRMKREDEQRLRRRAISQKHVEEITPFARALQAAWRDFAPSIASAGDGDGGLGRFRGTSLPALLYEGCGTAEFQPVQSIQVLAAPSPTTLSCAMHQLQVVAHDRTECIELPGVHNMFSASRLIDKWEGKDTSDWLLRVHDLRCQPWVSLPSNTLFRLVQHIYSQNQRSAVVEGPTLASPSAEEQYRQMVMAAYAPVWKLFAAVQSAILASAPGTPDAVFVLMFEYLMAPCLCAEPGRDYSDDVWVPSCPEIYLLWHEDSRIHSV